MRGAGLALAALVCFQEPARAQDLRLALDAGLQDLALFTLASRETRISGAGRALLHAQGFLHDGPVPERLQSGQALVPVIRHDSNVNDGIPADHITLGGLRFTVNEESRAKEAVLAGVRYANWRAYSYAPGARLTFAQSYTIELEPTWGFHHIGASARACGEQPVAGWTWIDACLTGTYVNDSIDRDHALTGTIGLRRLFRTAAGYHRAAISLGRSATDDYGKSTVHATLATLTAGHGLVTLGLIWGAPVAGENTLRHAVSAQWSGPVADRNITLGVSHATTAGATLFGTAREDRIMRLSLSVPVRSLEIGGFVERRHSTIDAYEETNAGVTIEVRINLLDGLL